MNSALREPLAPPADASAAQADVDRHVAVQPLASAIYEGWVRHRRHAPRAHAFRYRMAMLYLDLAELPALFAGRWLWSSDRRNVAEFRRGDYLGPAELPLDEAVRMASTYPAEFLGLGARYGRISPGFRADLVLLDEALQVRSTWIAGVREDVA